MNMNVKNMSESIKNFFQDTAEQTATETKFVQRKPKLTGSIFLQTFVFGLLENPKSSLSDFAAFCEEHFGITISAQGIDERLSGCRAGVG